MSAIHLFNPGHETAVLSGKESYTPPANVRKMQEDLALLPLWFADAGDYVWTEQEKNHRFVSLLPQVVQPKGTLLSPKNISAFASKEMKACPWGWSPQIVRRFNDLNKKYGTTIQTPEWNTVYTQLTGRQTAAECIQRLQPLLPGLDIPTSCCCSTIEDIEDYLKRNPGRCLIKTPYSSSGRGLLWIKENVLSDKDKAWIKGAIQKQGCLTVEKGLEKEIDFAMEFHIDQQGKIAYEGLSLFSTRANGSYNGNFMTSRIDMEEILGRHIDLEMFTEVQDALLQILPTLFGNTYQGYLGVDMMGYKNTEGQTVIHPCVEINMRYTMGMVALRLRRQHIHEDGVFSFYVVYEKDAYRNHQWMKKAHPLTIEDGKIKEGYLSLCPVREDTRYWAYIIG